MGRGVSGRLQAPRRRDFLQAIGASGAVLATFGASTVSATPELADFVEAEGGEFVVDGRPVYFNGTNNFWVTNESVTTQRVDDCMALFADMGIDLLRTWAHCEAKGGRCLQNEPGVHNEAALQHLDYVVARASEYGIRLVLALVDNWEHEGGIPQYIEWVDGAENRGDFYTMDETRALYTNHVETILTRENTLTGVEYRDDPAIAMWELGNEPRCEADDVHDGVDHAQVYHDWVADMSAFIKDLDPNHLVSTGAEGFYTRSGASEFFYNDWTGQDFLANNAIDTIDACSFHMYPYHWDHPPDSAFPLDHGAQWITEHLQDAHQQVGKPVYLGEFNVNRERGLQTRNQYLEEWYALFDEYDGNAVLPWQLVLDDTDDHDGFQIYRGESGSIIESYGSVARSKSGGSSDAPIADATSPGTLRLGETGAFDASYSTAPTGSIASYEWTFGDGTTATGRRVLHSFDDTGNVEVELTVTDDAGRSSTDTEAVTVVGIPDDSFIVEGAGRQVHQDVNEFHFAYGTHTGDFTVDVRVASVSPTNPSAQAGIMALDSLDVPGALGAVAVSPSEGVEMVRSYDEGTPTWRERLYDDRSTPLWLRLERTGGVVTGFVSMDGSSWTEIQSGEADLDEEVHLGLFVSSNAPGTLCTAQFDEVSWLHDWSNTDVGDVQVPGNAVAGTGETGGGDGIDVNGYTAQDLDGDGRHRDVNGNDRLDFQDVVAFFEEMQSDGVQNNVTAFDFNDNGSIDFDDVVALFEQI